MSRNPTAPPPPKLPTFETTTTRGTGLSLREAVIARSRVPTRRKVSAATIARVYVGVLRRTTEWAIRQQRTWRQRSIQV